MADAAKLVYVSMLFDKLESTLYINEAVYSEVVKHDSYEP